MNLHGLLGTLKALLQAETWGGPEPVFAEDSVIVTIAPDQRVYQNYNSPMAFLVPGQNSVDPQEPRLITQSVVVRLVVVSDSDATGEGVLMGAHPEGSLDSRGRGLLEVEERLMAAINLLDGNEGVTIEFKAASAGKAQLLDGKVYVGVRDYEFEARITTLT